jgi:hypothetical protein
MVGVFILVWLTGLPYHGEALFSPLSRQEKGRDGGLARRCRWHGGAVGVAAKASGAAAKLVLAANATHTISFSTDTIG